jgi:hypothetical protein
MTQAAHELLNELRRRGAIAYRVGDRLRVRPADVVPAELVDRLREHKAALLSLVPEHSLIDYEANYVELTASAGTADDLATIARHARLNGDWVAGEIAWLDQRCTVLAQARADESSYRAAVLLLIARIDELGRWQRHTSLETGARRAVIEKYEPPVTAGPLTLADGTPISKVGRFMARLLAGLDYAVSRNESAAVIKILLGQLAALGIAARVEDVQ